MEDSMQTSFPQLLDMEDGEEDLDDEMTMMSSFDEEDQEFLRDIMQQTTAGRHHHYLSSQAETENSGNNIGYKDQHRMMMMRMSPSPRACILSFDNSEEQSRCSSKRKIKRKRSGTFDHIMAERRRRQRISDKFIALSATIPGLKKLDKATILDEAIKYVKQLEERVRELERESSVISIKRIEVCENEEEWYEVNEVLPKIEARVSGNEMLLGIHCEKQKGVGFKILNLLQNFHLSVTTSTILPFGDSALGITIIARMGDDEHRMRVNDVVKKLRQILSKSHHDS